MLPITHENPLTTKGNATVVKMLEQWLEQAKKGRMNYIALVGAEGPDQITHGLAGSLGLEFGINWGLDRLKEQLSEERKMRQRPQDPYAPADQACFNLMQMAPSFDFMNWLAIAKMKMDESGLPGPLKVAFWYGKIKETWKDDPARPGMLENVCKPALQFVGAVEDEAAVTGRTYDQFLLRSVTQMANEGHEVPEFRATDEARKSVNAFLLSDFSRYPRRPVVITLREAPHWPHRNSNLDEWLKFARYLQRNGEEVVFVRDTAKADQPIPDYEFDIYPEASRDLDIRLALYEQAKCSLFAANGPWNLAVFGKWPWLMFNEALPDDPFEFNRPEGWMRHNGISVGEQLPWSLPTQRIIWGRDTYDVMRRAWEEYAPLLQKQERAA